MEVINWNLGWTNFFSIATHLLISVKTAIAHSTSQSIDTSAQIGPYSLVQLAYEGKLLKQGIPSGSHLINAHRAGQLKAAHLVAHAVQAKLMPTSVMTDLTYLDQVETGFLFHYLWKSIETESKVSPLVK
jgi:hypothetical protein